MNSDERERDASGTTQRVVAAAMRLASRMPLGYAENVYVRALASELRECGFEVASPQPLQVAYDSLVIGETYGDLLVDDNLIVELIAGGAAADDRHQQICLSYLQASGHESCLLLHFSSSGVKAAAVTKTPLSL